MKMQAVKDFRGKEGEGKGEKKRMVTVGDEFTPGGDKFDKGRADYLEKAGLAVPVGGAKAEGASPKNKMEAGAEHNKAEGADAGDAGDAGETDSPLAGGRTGGEEQSSLSDQVQPERVNHPTSPTRGGTRRRGNR